MATIQISTATSIRAARLEWTKLDITEPNSIHPATSELIPLLERPVATSFALSLFASSNCEYDLSEMK